VLVAFVDQQFAGYVTVRWHSDYPAFRAADIPEIQDFNVLPVYRRQGIGTRLLDDAERIIARRSPVAGIGVGLYADYGAAQRLYVRRGYVPDGRGIFVNERCVQPGEQVIVDDDLVLYFTKTLADSSSGA
jgi:GNAT superfamily N-acetyltransferase